MLLQATGLGRRFGGVVALEDYRLTLGEGERFALIGPNGAGKTTAFNCLSGVLRPSSGRIRFLGRDVTGWPAHRMARLGLARTFQHARPFADLSVLENVMAGLHARSGAGLLATLLGLPAFLRAERRIREEALAILELVGLADEAGRRAGDLPYGRQRLVEIARALATAPRLLLLDEPAAGMNPAETDQLQRMLHRLQRRTGVTLMIVEHDMRLVMNLCSRIQVLHRGRIIAEGPPEAIQSHPEVIHAYLGQRRRHAAVG